MKRISGIYCIENVVNHKKYIGKSIDIYKRWYLHKLHLSKNKHHNKYLQFSWNKYGCDCFDFYIIEECEESKLNDREMYYIEIYNTTNDLYGYNLTSGGDGGNTIAGYTEEEFNAYCKRKSEILKDKIPHGENSSSSKLKEYQVKEIIERLINGEHPDLIYKDYNISLQAIEDIRNHRTWTYLTKNIVFPKIHKKYHKNGKTVCQFSMNGELLATYSSAREAERETKISYKQISQVCHGEKRMSHGFIFRFGGDAFNKYPTKLKSEL